MDALDALIAVQPDDFPSEAAAGEWDQGLRQDLEDVANHRALAREAVAGG